MTIVAEVLTVLIIVLAVILAAVYQSYSLGFKTGFLKGGHFAIDKCIEVAQARLDQPEQPKHYLN